MKFVIIESPYSGNIVLNEKYARACVADCIARGETCFASHLFFTQPGILDENLPEERLLGIQLGYEIMKRADKVVVYHDLGFSDGMLKAMQYATGVLEKSLEFRLLPNWKT
jgi:hypothetical protein